MRPFTFAQKRSLASKRSLNPPNWSNHKNSTDFLREHKLKYLLTIDPGTLPISIAAAKSFGTVSTDLPASKNAIIASSLLLSLWSSLLSSLLLLSLLV